MAANSQVSLKSLIYSILIIIGLLIVTGVIGWQKESYACFNGKKLNFGDRVEMVSLGSFRIRPYVLRYDCAEEDRYDPTKLTPCGYQHYCRTDVDS